jgi:hypothetical protein
MSTALIPATNVVDKTSGATGLFLGWTNGGRALVWWDRTSGAKEVDPSTLKVAS